MTTHLPISLQRKDKVVISLVKLIKLFEWRDNNKDLVRNFTPFLIDVVIDNGGLSIHVENSDKLGYTHKFTLYEKGVKRLVHYWDRFTMLGDTAYKDLPQYKDRPSNDPELHDYIQTVISVYTSLMAYMEHYKEFVNKKEVVNQKSKERKKKGKVKSKAKKVTYIRNTVYTLSGDIDTTKVDKNKRSYTKSDEPFKVRGHWRTYKNGNKVWIKEHVRNDKKGQRPGPKTYKL